MSIEGISGIVVVEIGLLVVIEEDPSIVEVEPIVGVEPIVVEADVSIVDELNSPKVVPEFSIYKFFIGI